MDLRGGSAPPKDRATDQNGVHRGRVPRTGGGARPQFQHSGAASSSSWSSRPPAPTKPRSAPTRSTVAEKKPFAVIVASAPRGHAVAGQVFAADLVAKKIIVFYGGITNAEAAQAGAVPVARRLRLQRGRGQRRAVRRAPAPGRDREVVGRLHRPRSACSARSTPSAASTGTTSRAPRRRKASSSRQAPSSSTPCRSTPARPPAKNQEEAPVLVAKLKDAGVTTVMLFASVHDDQARLQGRRQPRLPPRVVVPGLSARRTSRSPRGSSTASAPTR